MPPRKGVNATGPVPAERTVEKENRIWKNRKTPPAEGLEKCAPKPADACDISRRERWLLAVTFAFCLLTVNTLFDAGAGAGWAAAVAGWYAVLYASHGPALWRTGESRFLLVTNLALALFSLVLGSSDCFRMWDTLALLLVLLPVTPRASRRAAAALVAARHAVGAACLLLSGFFSRLGAFPAALSPGWSGAGRRLGPAVLGCARGGGAAGHSGAVPGVGGRAVRPRHRGPPGPSWTSTSRRPRPRPWPPP